MIPFYLAAIILLYIIVYYIIAFHCCITRFKAVSKIADSAKRGTFGHRVSGHVYMIAADG